MKGIKKNLVYYKTIAVLLFLITAINCNSQKNVAVKKLFKGENDLLIGNSDFEGDTYGDWIVTGEAFNKKPVSGSTFKGKGYAGKKLASSLAGNKEDATGSLTSPEFTIQRKYINFLISGGNWPKELRINLLINGKEEMFETGNQFDDMLWMSWDVSGWIGKKAKIVIEDKDSSIDRHDLLDEKQWEEVNLPMAHINIDQIVQSNSNRQYQEKFRPQFHFSPQRNWINDPNGLIYAGGVWHLFAQHDPYLLHSTDNQSWLHSSSTDLLHWVEDPQVPEVLLNNAKTGRAFTGAGMIDHENLLGLKAPGANAPDVLIVYYLRTKKGLFYAYSDDAGKTWKEYSGNPVIHWDNTIKSLDGNRIDAPKPTRLTDKTWIAPMFDDRKDSVTTSENASNGTLQSGTGVTFIVSDDLKTWHQKQKKILEFGEAECLEAFEMPVYNTTGQATGDTQWVMNMGHDGYALAYLKEGHQKKIEDKEFNFSFDEKQTTVGGTVYCPMTWYNAPDNRRVQITWANSWSLGGNQKWPGIDYPDMPFKSQMTFPIDLKMVDYGANGRQLTRTPVKEISKLYIAGKTTTLGDIYLKPGPTNPLAGVKGELFDIEADIEPLDGNTEFGFQISEPGKDYTVVYETNSNALRLKGFDNLEAAPKDKVQLKMPNASIKGQHITIRILVDRSLIEAFAGDGRVYFTGTMFPDELEKKLAIYAKGGSIKIHQLEVRKLKSIH